MDDTIILIWVTVGCSTIILLAGLAQQKWPPKKINPLYGYRTPLSKRTQATWDAANAFSTQLMIKLGFVHFLGSFFFFILPPFDTFIYMGYIMLTVPISIAMMLMTERMLRQNFTKDGQPLA